MIRKRLYEKAKAVLGQLDLEQRGGEDDTAAPQQGPVRFLESTGGRYS